MPKTKLGRWSVWLILAMPVLFILGSLAANTLYKDVLAGDTILWDMTTRPVLAWSMLIGMICGISAFITGLTTIIKDKERALLVYASTAFGALLLLFLVGEVVVPH